MQKITLKNYAKKGDDYHVFLGNGNAYEFRSKRKAVAFLNETSKFLSLAIYNLQEFYIQSWTIYEQTYFLLKIDKEYGDNAIMRNCENALASINRARDLAIMRCTWQNGAVFTFHHLKVFGENIKTILREIRQVHKRNSNTPMLYRITNLYRLVMQTLTEIRSYKEEECIFLFDVDFDEELAKSKIIFFPKPKVAA